MSKFEIFHEIIQCIKTTKVVDEIEADREKYVGQDISVIINQMRYAAIDKEIQKFARKWYLNVAVH